MSLILDLLFPKICYSCGQKGEYLCSKCQKHINIINVKSPKYGFDGGLSLFNYHSIIKSAIIDLKYNFVSDNVDSLSNLMAKKIKSNFPNLVKHWQKNNFILIPIPLHQSRHFWRGFNQSELLASSLASKLHLDYSNEVLIRNRKTDVQAKLKNIKDRTKNVANIFSLNQSLGKLEHKNFIIFDDVSTTLSTLKSAQNTLKILSPKYCWYLTLSAG